MADGKFLDATTNISEMLSSKMRAKTTMIRKGGED